MIWNLDYINGYIPILNGLGGGGEFQIHKQKKNTQCGKECPIRPNFLAAVLGWFIMFIAGGKVAAVILGGSSQLLVTPI